MLGAAEERWTGAGSRLLLGGAIGDALGGPVEFEGGRRSLPRIPIGVRTFVVRVAPAGRAGTITDDTQMTLFTVEGLIRAGVRTDRGIGFTVAWCTTRTTVAGHADAAGSEW